MPLFDWQRPVADAALKSLRDTRMFVNACTTGAGKTFICGDVIRRLGTPHLVVAPKAARTQWFRVMEDMGVGDLILDVINPEQISKPSGCAWYDRENLWKIPKDTCLVFDEIHRGASGPKSLTANAVAQLRAYPGSMLHAMSATAACSPLQLRVLGYWAGMHGFNDPSFYRWCRRNGCSDVPVGRGISAAGRSAFRFTRDPKEAAEIMRQIRAGFGERFCALGPDDIPGFPDQIIRTKLVDLRKRDREEIEKAYREMSARMKEKASASIAETGRERERIEFIMAGAAAELVAGSVEDGNSAVIFFNFTEPRERFIDELKKVYDGGISQIYGGQKDDRQSNIDLFQNNVNLVIVVNTEAGGAALSLHDERHERPRESFIIPSYNAASVRQALGRIRRVNGTTAVQNFLLAAGTVQERVKVNLDLKIRNIDALNDGDLFPS